MSSEDSQNAKLPLTSREPTENIFEEEEKESEREGNRSPHGPALNGEMALVEEEAEADQVAAGEDPFYDMVIGDVDAASQEYNKRFIKAARSHRNTDYRSARDAKKHVVFHAMMKYMHDKIRRDGFEYSANECILEEGDALMNEICRVLGDQAAILEFPSLKRIIESSKQAMTRTLYSAINMAETIISKKTRRTRTERGFDVSFQSAAALAEKRLSPFETRVFEYLYPPQ
uniref:Uncharacterized protein n=1 Tax=Palpitomonas bilix TaxID=652834 RepID=A0A7S3DHI0_9EUKA|mmetsp:Transcript_38126/g.98461  ORF Transcript_38126/g.98461 Transcript_38126/m.98461 type:complete len:230 (+) Transcript_38126:245-934(+)